MSKFTISLRDSGGQRAHTTVETEEESVGAYVTLLNAWSAAGVTGANKITAESLTTEQLKSPEAGSNIDVKVYITGQRASGEFVKIVVHAPIFDAAHFVKVMTPEGERITEVSGSAFCTAYAGAVGGGAINFLRGTIVQRT